MTALVCQMPGNQRIHIKDLREKKDQTYAKNISDLRIPVPFTWVFYWPKNTLNHTINTLDLLVKKTYFTAAIDDLMAGTFLNQPPPVD